MKKALEAATSRAFAFFVINALILFACEHYIICDFSSQYTLYIFQFINTTWLFHTIISSMQIHLCNF